jgi:tight adherence protein B
LIFVVGIASLAMPRFAVMRLRAIRTRRIAAQLPDALSLWAGLLRSGQGITQALAQVADHQSGPMGEELRLLVRQCRIGLSIESGVEELRTRTGVADLTMIGTLLRATQLADVMRSRLAMELRIRSLTAQGRLQGLIVGLLPILLLAVLTLMEPVAMSALYQQPLGWVAMTLIVVLEAVGFLLIRRIVNIQV